MEFLQGIGSKTGAMPLSTDVMYIFHIRPEAPDALFERQDKNRAIDTLRRGKRIDRNDALRLGRILVGLVPNEPEAFGLLALMEVQASRFAARIGPDGQRIVAAAG
jgi:predicted RNA polymerase sigma factor